MKNWLSKSNRQKHLLYAIIPAMLLTVLFAAGLAVGMEFKDRQYGNKFDWLDIAATLIGGVIGQVLQLVLIYIIVKVW